MKPLVLGILEDLIRIESVNPHYEEGAQGETEVTRYIEHFCINAGLPCYRQPVLPGRDNLIVELTTGHPDRVLLFEAHMDTVSVGSMTDPFAPRYDGNRLYGRGSCDTKGSLSAMLAALEFCARNRDRFGCDIVLCASVDEEYAYRGLTAFMDLNMNIHGAVVGERLISISSSLIKAARGLP
ncbi:M20 family metallopeptidase [Cohnella kolymensis]|uniref:M20 family metallopeptidase n=1 Tax=Cohnella kolymensis TaxID=1590652 RepID=UPI0006990D35|nr:M20/M25/M40 family metallo-hydrolase [Cohnella kolymensis]